jgi:integrase
LRPGDHGRITERARGGRFFASTYVRDADGQRRRLERSSAKSIEDARRELHRELAKRRTPLSNQAVTGKTSLAELFEIWLEAKGAEDGVRPQIADTYRAVWEKHGAAQLGALRVTELPTSRANAHLQAMGRTAQAKPLRMILSGMFSLAVRFDVLPVNPIKETKTLRTARKPARAATEAEFVEIRAAVKAYAGRTGPTPGPHRGACCPRSSICSRLRGARPGEVLALRWADVDLLGDPPTVTITGTLIDHGRIAGMPLHRQDRTRWCCRDSVSMR